MKTLQPIRVLLVDESMVSLQGLRTLLSQSKRLTIVDTATSETEAMAAIQRHKPDVVVLDVEVKGASGITMCRVIRRTYPEVAVVIFTAHDSKNLLHEAILAGAQGYLLKSASSEAVITSLETVSAGQAVMDYHLTSQILAWVREIGQGPPGKSIDGWSQDDLQLLALIAQGNTNKEIANELCVTGSAVSTRLRRIYRRLSISRRSEAAMYFVQHGLESLQSDHKGRGAKSMEPAGKPKGYRCQHDS